MTMTPKEAVAAGLEPLAGPYAAHEMPMLGDAVKQLGTINCAVVTEPDGLNLWRDKRGMRLYRGGDE